MIQKNILAEPKQFQMEEFWTYYISNVKIPNCGTAACIGGWAMCLTRKIKPAELALRGWRDNLVAIEIGTDLIKLKKLIWFYNWPEKFRHVRKEGTVAFARQAVRRIEHFIQTNGE
jgi:hypothetical protein